MKSSRFALLAMFLLTVTLISVSAVKAIGTIELTPAERHHLVKLNSNQPYVAGYHVNTPDLLTRERVDATAITVSFPSTDTRYFPSDSWLGAGMFVQAQDSRLKHVDYAFYTMLVIDASGKLFLDVGLRETRESTAPLQMPTEELIYAYTWQISGIDAATPVTLQARWHSEGFINYSISISGTDINITRINVATLPNCESIVSKFYAGNYIAGTAFPFGHYVYYFQFGVISPKTIADEHWTADLKDPKILRQTGRQPVETAWSTQGDIAYLDWDWTWGGAPYYGVSAEYYQNPLENPYEVRFSYTGKTLPPGTILWQPPNKQLGNASTAETQVGFEYAFLLEPIVSIKALTVEPALRKLRKKQ